MTHIKKATAEQVTDFFLSDPALCYLALPDEDLINLHEKKIYIPSKEEYLFGVWEKTKLVGIVRYSFFTSTSVNLHLYIHTEAHKTQLSKDIQQQVKNYIRDYTVASKIMLMVPKPCHHVQKPAKTFGFVLEGCLTDVLIWRKELVDVYIYSLNLQKSET